MATEEEYRIVDQVLEILSENSISPYDLFEKHIDTPGSRRWISAPGMLGKLDKMMQECTGESEVFGGLMTLTYFGKNLASDNLRRPHPDIMRDGKFKLVHENVSSYKERRVSRPSRNIEVTHVL